MREKLEKELSDLVEKNLEQQSKGYNLNYRHDYFTTKMEQAGSKTNMLSDKLKFMATTLAKSIRD